MRLVVAPDRILYTPARPGAQETEGRYELRGNEDDLVALAFTSREQLVAGCGVDQPWLAAPAGALLADWEAAGVAAVVIDGTIGESARWSAEKEPQ